MPSFPRRVALVLSGGGARGAYAVGVVAGLSDILGGLRSRFDFFTGTSVGAINAAHFAAHADRGDLGVARLVGQYAALRLSTHLRPHFAGLFGSPGQPRRQRPHGWALLDARPVEHIVRDDIPWPRLHENVRDGLVRALIVSGLRVSDGRTTTFAELAPGVDPLFDGGFARLLIDLGHHDALARADEVRAFFGAEELASA